MSPASRKWIALLFLGLVAFNIYMGIRLGSRSREGGGARSSISYLESDAVGKDARLLGESVAPLYAAAKAEGIVDIWAASVLDLKWIPAAFNKTFPGIKVNVHGAPDVAAKVKSNLRDGRNDVDVVWNSESLIQPLIEDHLLVQDEWLKSGVRSENIGARGHMAITNSVAYAIAYRDDAVASKDVPQFWDQLTEERYRDKFAASPQLAAFLFAALGSFEGDLKWLEFAKKFGEESGTLWTGNLERVVLGGERPYVVAISSHHANSWLARGLPIKVVLPEPVFIAQFGAVVLRSAPHPNAARLLGSWLAGPQGRAARERALYAVDLRSSSNHPKAVELRGAGKRIYDDTEAAMAARAKLLPKVQLVLSLTSQGSGSATPPTTAPRQ